MIVLFIILAILCILLFFLLLPLRLYIVYRTDDENPSVYLKILFFRFPLFPDRKGKVNIRKHRQKSIKKKRKKKAEPSKEPPTPKKKRSLLTRLRLIFWLVRYLYKNLFEKLHVKIERLRISVATEDAAKTALLYGGVSQAVAYFLEFCDEHGTLHPLSKKQVFVRADFLSSKIDIDVKICLWLRAITGITLALKLLGAKNKKTKTNREV